MKYFFDTEFIEDGRTIDLISIGIVAEDGREYYALNYDCDWSKASDWVKENVLAQLPPQPLPCLHSSVEEYKNSEAGKQGWANKSVIALDINLFVGYDKKPKFWAYYADYDWVAFCQLWGTMMDLPEGFPMYCCDLKQEADRVGVDLSAVVPQQDEHHALADARWNKAAWEYLEQNYD